MGYDPDLDPILDQIYARLDALETQTPPPPTPPVVGIPVGPWVYGYDYHTEWANWTSAVFDAWTPPNPPPETGNPASLIDNLTEARRIGSRMFMSMAGAANTFMNPNRTYSQSMFKQNVAYFFENTPNLDTFIRDRTLYGCVLVDEPTWHGTWGGQIITSPELDEMARWVKTFSPNLPCLIRDDIYDLAWHMAGWNIPIPGFQWEHVDGTMNQYRADKKPIGQYREAVLEQSELWDMSIVFGINWQDGGNGSSERASQSWPGHWNMSPQEVTDYSTDLLAGNYASGFSLWRYPHPNIPSSVPYWNNPNTQAGFDVLKQQCATYQGPPLLKR